MNVNYIGKKTTVKDNFKDYAEKRLSKLTKFFGNDVDITVVVTNYNETETVEVTLKSQGMFFRAEKSSDDRSVSLDLVTDVLFNQIVKNKTRLERKFRTDDASFFEDYSASEDDTPDEIVKTKKFDISVMNTEEAILQMNMLNHNFFMFRNGDTGEVNVVYKRKDNNYGVLEPI